MLSQDGALSDAPTTRLAKVSTPSSESSIVGDASGGRKRKRDGSSMEDLLKDSFVVKPYPSQPCRPRTLQSLILLPRSCLPLSCLDLTSSVNSLPPSRLFESHVKILELEERMGTQPMVLIARLDDGKLHYAVEREDRGLYVLCQLGSWVNVQQLRSSAVAFRQEPLMVLDRALGTIRNFMDPAAVPLITPESSKYTKKKRLAIEAIQSMVKRPTAALTTSQSAIMEPQSTQVLPLEEAPEQSQQQAPVEQENVLTVQAASLQSTGADIFENVRNQYLEALYLSKASLAYFAKGPLSRARAAFHLDYDSALDMNQYIEFLESIIISTNNIDKKYREGVPECVSNTNIHDPSADEASQAKTKKRKTSKKMKLGKKGLYPQEHALIRKWWTAHDEDLESGSPDSSREHIMNRRIGQLRIRETQLQIIVTLEVLALKPLATATQDTEDGLPGDARKSAVSVEPKKLNKLKNSDHLSTLIDLHIDRLCIWQSIALETDKTSVSSTQHGSERFGGSSKNVDNFLRDFCIEVIIPFFSARLPDRCTSINRKLGGPVVVTPPKARLSKSASFSGTASRPGTATKRPVPTKPRRSLQRVLTDERERRSESRGPSRAISLMRSATMPSSIPSFKREGSEAPSLSSIPEAQGARGGLLNSKQFARREIDFGSLAPDTNAAKAKRQAQIDAELKEAILGLKKPNREQAVKDLVEHAEKRSASASHSRKLKKPIRNPLFQSVQVSATPRLNRQKDVYDNSQSSGLPRMADEIDVSFPSSSVRRIPQSAVRSTRESQIRNPLQISVQATPTRKAASGSQHAKGFLAVSLPDSGICLPSSPLEQRDVGLKLFDHVPDSEIKKPTEMLFDRPGIQETPVKRRPATADGHAHPVTSALGGDQENERQRLVKARPAVETVPAASSSQGDSIYRSLGWDDDIDELA